MLNLIEKGGVIMIVIIALSVIAAVIIIERMLFFRRIKSDEQKIIANIRGALEQNHFYEAIAICESDPSPVSNLMKVGIEHRFYSQAEIKDAIMSAANLEIPRLEKYLSLLGTIAHITPLLGLLGTVTGNIEAFGVLGQSGSLGDPSRLASGISEALLTTAAGLIVSIPATVFYNQLVQRVNHMILRMENSVNDLVLLLKGKDNAF
ncbi:MAG: MotA/TolQ/ExbB proton channel family protein [Spirochaetales bacterium]|nr:MotA/TolQ/ExbB proton channel family protein [Spirochaetales bacterium]